MNIIPYGHSGLGLSRVPWATIVIFVACMVAFVLTNGASERAGATSAELYDQIVRIYLADPTLELDPRILDFFLRGNNVDENQREVYLDTLAKWAARNPSPGAKATQEELDRLTERYWAVYRSSPKYRFGLVPDDATPLSHLTHTFMHSSWGHLLSNMFVFFLVGPYLEQRWGRPLFVGCFLGAGLLTGVLWVVRHPHLDIPTVGASGAIAGLMGAFLICFAAAKIRFAYWYVVVWGAFEVPAWLVLPIWLAKEVIAGREQDLYRQYAGGGGIGHWTHVWGFIFGMAFAWGLGLFGLDPRRTEVRLDDSAPALPNYRSLDRLRQVGQVMVPVPEAAFASPLAGGSAFQVLGVPQRGPWEPGFEGVQTGEPLPRERRAVGHRRAERLRMIEAVPRAIGESVARFAVGAAVHRLDLDQVEAIAVGAVEQPGGRPFIVIDLLLDPPWDDDVSLRLVRLRSSTFDPRAIVGGEDAMEALTRLLDRLLASCEAEPLPDAEHLRSPGATTYTSLEEYQREVLGVVGAEEGGEELPGL
jgi:membrane associated rhomboid family serine protease